ncbi:hypothetical protein FSP39_002717, partial [Pinctada imbricata]
NEEEKDFDPWEMPELKDTETPWNELTGSGKLKRVLWILARLVLFLGFLYIFICSLDFLSSAFRLLGGRAAGEVFRDNELLRNPVCGVMIGVLATVLVQSSSTSTSIVVTMVGAGLLEVRVAIPIIMGSNIGTSVTNTIVSFGQITAKNDFRRAFAGATVHDMFNWLSVIILLPLESATGYLFFLSDTIVSNINEGNENADVDLLKVITSPLTKSFIEINFIIAASEIFKSLSLFYFHLSEIDQQVDSSAITKIAQGKGDEVTTLQKICCKSKDVFNTTSNETMKICLRQCDYVFSNTGLSDVALGAIILVIALILLCVCLFSIVKTLNSLLKGNIRKGIRRFVNNDFPGKAKYFTGYLAIIVGTCFTILVQSSSIFTSTLTPLIGVGVISIQRAYPLTLGSNIGTTTTSILAALANDNLKDLRNSLQIAFCHLFFNLTGIIIFYPIPFMRVPIGMAKFLGNQTAKYRWFAIAYLLTMFLLLPLVIFGLSIAGWYVLLAVCAPIVILVIVISTIKCFQKKRPESLHPKLRNWKFLPEPLRSLRPLDRLLTSCCKCFSDSDKKENDCSDIAEIKTVL